MNKKQGARRDIATLNKTKENEMTKKEQKLQNVHFGCLTVPMVPLNTVALSSTMASNTVQYKPLLAQYVVWTNFVLGEDESILEIICP